ncbi:hypothetical protein A5320_09020 [Rheinheimera sp. SA_1]|uniref:hypothetical protein n=1 Tax=Rheinheimera sp. SA_1 TaxID=1827365 RepID=UPI000802541A|nr:hypothetical protein [Rheinheimera sp. SA_1]OBP15482.1 hypothetical protein A5320_09020 [Rheinheimera sp. SA_1]
MNDYFLNTAIPASKTASKEPESIIGALFFLDILSFRLLSRRNMFSAIWRILAGFTGALEL